MTALIAGQRYNWMGYNGTESKEVDGIFIRGGNDAGIADYWRRRSIIDDIKRRLHLIKGDLDLIPEEELRAEREAARRRRAAREAEEPARQAQDEECEDMDYDAYQAEEDARRSSESQFEERTREIMQRTAGISEAECNGLLENMPRTKAEVQQAVSSFSARTRAFLVRQGAYYVSYLDGSWHTSLEKLEQHNFKFQSLTERALEGTGVGLPLAEDYSTAELRDAAERLEVAQQKLQAYLCQVDRTHVMRLRKADKDERGNPIVLITEEDGDEEALRRKVDDALADMVSLREAYNKRSAACGKKLATLTISSEQLHDSSA
ncbi:unnamed protein product [Phytomonas sp. EM1]|nr:unnamed protein product [Phytomonas sp. EM1]|eukprot:CCW64707.1 unnamed protein product [Phytomonas sp. isolate EM1]